MKIKTEKGITLVSLIITVVILLILSIVAISSLKNDGIFGYAQNATSQFEEGQGNEQGVLNGYVDSLNNINVEKEEPVKTISFKIRFIDNVGGSVNTCLAEEGMTWRDWCASSYNAGEEFLGDGYLFEIDGIDVMLDGGVTSYYLIGFGPEDVIESGEEYIFENDNYLGGGFGGGE